MLRVGLLGVFRVETVDSRIWSALGPAGRGLASFLFTYPDRPHRRERLADLFWPDLDSECARRALNSAIWRLRKLLAAHPESDEGLRTIGPDIVLKTAPWLDIDAAALQSAAMTVLNEPAALSEPRTLNRVVAALHRYKGPFLDGDDGSWILEERERLHSLFVQTTMLTVCRLGAVGRYHDAVDLARRALRFDPYREELVRYLLMLLVLDERRCEAIQYFQSWTNALKAELGITPLPATRKLLDEIKGLDTIEGFTGLRERIAARVPWRPGEPADLPMEH
jgi:DNA-binding SARP family transcriptional activator